MGCSQQTPVNDEKPKIVFVIGGPGCGKGTQCKRIVKNFEYESFSTGDLLRQYVKDKKNGYEDIENQMKEGKLISSATLMKVLKEYILNSRNKKILVDGYPRNQENIDEWEKQMKGLVDVKGALYIEVSNEEMTKRLLGRNEGRADDNEETIKKRLTTFEKETKPIVSYFERQGNLIKINGERTVDEISQDIADKFKEKGLY
jgi:adenylate kinase family enzyme